jgi:predicted SnoaL-like aldol condensation-catalyzing enzyme
MVTFKRTSAKALINKRNNKKVNWFIKEAKQDVKGLSKDELKTCIKRACRQWNSENEVQHNRNFLRDKKAVIHYFIGLFKDKEDKKAGRALNQNPYIYTLLAWFEVFAFGD